MSEREANELFWTAIGYGVVAGAAVVALAGLWLFVPAFRQRWWPLKRLRPGYWTGRDVLLAFCALGFQVFIIVMLLQIGFFANLIGPEPDRAAFKDDNAFKDAARAYGIRCGAIASPLYLAVTLGVVFASLFVRTSTRPHHLGLTWARWPANLGLGLAAVVLVAPFVLGLHSMTTIVLGDQGFSYVVLARDIKNDWEWIVLAFMLVVAAPLIEEVIFRGVLLGWLRRATLAGHLGVMGATILRAAFGAWNFEPVSQAFTFNAGPLIFAAVFVGGYVYAMVRLARRYQLEEDEIQAWQPQASRDPVHNEAFCSKEAIRQSWTEANARLALYGSAMLFAIIHTDAWPAPIALFPLSLVLGALAQRTQSLIGPIVLHATFNLISFIALYGIAIQGDGTNGNACTMAAPPLAAGSMVNSVPASQLPLRK